MSGLRKAMFNAIWRCGFAPHEDPATVERMKAEWPEAVPKAQKRADAAILALRQWLADEGLVVVPREATKDVLWIGIKVRHEGASVEEIYAAMIAAAPDVLGKP
jgi:hypothetical protein